MLRELPLLLLVVAFVGAGVVNGIGRPAVKADFVRWGFPAWWCYATGGLEVVTALLVALPATRALGLLLGAAIVAAALLAVLRLRDFSHLAPLGAFAALLALAYATS